MKQIIVMVAMVVLGIAIAGFIGQYKGTIENITTETNKKIKSSCQFADIGGNYFEESDFVILV